MYMCIYIYCIYDVNIIMVYICIYIYIYLNSVCQYVTIYALLSVLGSQNQNGGEDIDQSFL